MGDARPNTPMPAETLRHSAAQMSQNCGVLCASRKWTLPLVTMAEVAALGVQPSGFQPAGGTR